MNTHTQLLNALIEKHGLKSYLEIGVYNTAHNFDKIKCDEKTGVDPALKHENIFTGTSDEYFMQHEDAKFDLIFIDGLHHADQVQKDFENSLNCLNDCGYIVIHDCLPENEEGTRVPRATKVWWGEVYKFAMTLSKYDGIQFRTLNMDHGCCVVWKDAVSKGIRRKINTSWGAYKSNGRTALKVEDEFSLEEIN